MSEAIEFDLKNEAIKKFLDNPYDEKAQENFFLPFANLGDMLYKHREDREFYQVTGPYITTGVIHNKLKQVFDEWFNHKDSAGDTSIRLANMLDSSPFLGTYESKCLDLVVDMNAAPEEEQKLYFATIFETLRSTALQQIKFYASAKPGYYPDKSLVIVQDANERYIYKVKGKPNRGEAGMVCRIDKSYLRIKDGLCNTVEHKKDKALKIIIPRDMSIFAAAGSIFLPNKIYDTQHTNIKNEAEKTTYEKFFDRVHVNGKLGAVLIEDFIEGENFSNSLGAKKGFKFKQFAHDHSISEELMGNFDNNLTEQDKNGIAEALLEEAADFEGPTKCSVHNDAFPDNIMISKLEAGGYKATFIDNTFAVTFDPLKGNIHNDKLQSEVHKSWGPFNSPEIQKGKKDIDLRKAQVFAMGRNLQLIYGYTDADLEAGKNNDFRKYIISKMIDPDPVNRPYTDTALSFIEYANNKNKDFKDGDPAKLLKKKGSCTDNFFGKDYFDNLFDRPLRDEIKEYLDSYIIDEESFDKHALDLYIKCENFRDAKSHLHEVVKDINLRLKNKNPNADSLKSSAASNAKNVSNLYKLQQALREDSQTSPEKLRDLIAGARKELAGSNKIIRLFKALCDRLDILSLRLHRSALEKQFSTIDVHEKELDELQKLSPKY